MNLKKINENLESMSIALNEGTWSSPFSKANAQKLLKLLQKPIPAEKAGSLLYHVTGDDELYNEIDDFVIRKEGNYDVRGLVVRHVLKWVKEIEGEIKAGSFYDKRRGVDVKIIPLLKKKLLTIQPKL